MSVQVWTLTDVRSDTFLADWGWRHSDGAASLRRRTLRGGLRDGLDVVEFDTGALRGMLLPDRGLGIWKLWHTVSGRGDLEIGWQSPLAGPVHPRLVPLDQADGLGWLAGFDELLCRCGLASNGGPEFTPEGRLSHGLHGRIANLPAQKLVCTVDDAAGTIQLTGTVEEARLFGPKLHLQSTLTARLGSSRLEIEDRVTNASASPGEMELLYHINVGAPLLVPGCRVQVPFRTMAPASAHSAKDLATWQTYPQPVPGVPETVWFFEPASDAQGRCEVLLEDAAGRRGLGVGFETATLPYFALWKNPLPLADGYVTGLEPCLNFPNVRSFEHRSGRVVSLAPGESRVFRLSLEVHGSEADVAAARQRVKTLQATTHPTVHQQPLPAWSPGVG